MSERSTYIDESKGLRFHGGMTCDIAGALALPDDELAGYFVEDGKPVPAADARARLGAWREQGYQVMPICDNPDARGYCAGHPVEPEPQPVPLRFCEPVKLVDEIRRIKAMNLSRKTGAYDAASQDVVAMMTRGFTHWPRCDNHDIHGLCLGHPETEGGGA